MRTLRYIFLAVLLLGGCGNVFGQDGIPTPEEIREITRLAEQQDISAQSNLGVSYHKGEGIPQDFQLAVKWFRRSAEQGDA